MLVKSKASKVSSGHLACHPVVRFGERTPAVKGGRYKVSQKASLGEKHR